MKQPLSRLVATIIATVAFLATGCDGAGSVVPVTGTVTLDGKPLADAEVVFHPDPAKGAGGDSASGFTDAQGRFTLRTGRTGKDGAAPGFYRVVVTDTAGVGDLTNPGGVPGEGAGGPAKGSDPKRPRLPATYSDQTRTPLTDVEVRAGDSPLTFDLKSGTR